MICPQCKTGYRDEFTVCADCGVHLIQALRDESTPDSLHQPCVAFITSDIHEANLVKSLLEGSGVDVYLYDANISRLNPFYTNAVGGIKLMVSSAQKELAREVLEEYRSGQGQSATTGHASPFENFFAKSSDDKSDAPQKPQRGVCPVCGAKPDPDTNFCDQCGNSLST